MAVLDSDNSDNAHVAVKLVMDLFRSFRPVLGEDRVQQFIDFAIRFYGKFTAIAKALEDDIAKASGTSQHPDGHRGSDHSVSQDADEDSRPIAPNMESCKALVECPFLVVLLFQTGPPQFAEKNLEPVVQAMLVALDTEVPNPPISAPKELRERYNDYFYSQVKVCIIPTPSTILSTFSH